MKSNVLIKLVRMYSIDFLAQVVYMALVRVCKEKHREIALLVFHSKKKNQHCQISCLMIHWFTHILLLQNKITEFIQMYIGVWLLEKAALYYKKIFVYVEISYRQCVCNYILVV